MVKNIGAVIGWKFEHQEGMETMEGKITKFPGGIPAQEEQDTWTAEYEARDKKAERVGRAFNSSDKDRISYELLFELINEIRLLKSQTVLTYAQFENSMKDKLT